MACNEHCYFCYQRVKENKLLDIAVLKSEISKFNGYRFPRTAIYGGEATMRNDLPDFIKVCADNSDNVSMTTNGTLLTEEKLKQYKDAGLKEMGISVPTIKNWDKMRSMPFEKFVDIIILAKKIITNVRINIVENKYNMNKEDDRFEFYDMIGFFTRKLELGVLICRNFTTKYEDLDLSIIGARKLNYKAHGCEKYESENGVLISYYEPVKEYNENNYIVSPMGCFTNWLKFVNVR